MSKILFYTGYYTLYLLSLLPFRVIYFISDGIYYLLYYVIGYRRKVVRMNLKNSFPEKSRAELLKIEKTFFRFMADLLMENVKLLSMSRESINKRFSLVNHGFVQDMLDQKQSILLATSHYGNWEWAAPGISSIFQGKILGVYKPLTNQDVGKVINSIRAQFGVLLVPMKQTMRTIAEQTDTYMAVLVSDQTPTRHEKNYFIDFLNQPTSVFQGLEKIAKLTGNPIVYMHIDRPKRGYYEASFKMLYDKPQQTAENEITKGYNLELENIIKAKPEFWIWSHKRWKHKPPQSNE
jgi:KDO2-lipid IV(A) lauroyltransferase